VTGRYGVQIMRPAAIAAVAVCALLSGCFGGSDGHPTGLASMTMPLVSGGSPAQRALIRSILRDALPTAIERVWIGRVPASQGGSPAGAHWVSVRIRSHASRHDPNDLPARGEAQTITDVFARSSRAGGLPAIVGASLHLHGPAGVVRYAQSWKLVGQPRAVGWAGSGQTLRDRIEAAVTGSGLQPASVKLLGLPVRSVELRATTASPAGLADRIERLFRALQPLRRPADPVGEWADLTMVEIDDSCGRPVAGFGLGGSFADPTWLCPDPFVIGGALGQSCPKPTRAMC
jgi:hypothetical protein